MRTKTRFACALVAAATCVGAAGTRVAQAQPAHSGAKGPCDIYAAAGTPCIAAHSTTRALYASYNGALYQVKRESDGKTLDVTVVRATVTVAGGYANAAAQDAFCAGAVCVINVIYDQSGHGNHLFQAAPGTFKGPAKGAFDTQPIADMAPISIGGHKAYGVFIMPGMGMRNNNATGLAIADEPEGVYYVVDGTHFDSGCCFDYGNSSTNGRAVGTGTMETTYFGTSTVWGSGNGPGPWVMSDMEAGLFSGHAARQNMADPTIDSWRFVTAVVDGGGSNRWDLRGGNAQQGALKTFYSGARPGDPDDGRYYPMHKQGGILLGTGGDNGNGSSGTFYEGVMTTGFPSEAATDAVQANIVAARYQAQALALTRVAAFVPGASQEVTEIFTNTTDAPVTGLRLEFAAPASWSAVISGTSQPTRTFAAPIAPGASVSATFRVTAPANTGAGFLTGRAAWKGAAAAAMHIETVTARARSVPPVKINEIRLAGSGNPTDQFIELYNASDRAVDLSKWTLIGTQAQWAPVRLAEIPSGTKLAAGGFYLLGLANSGLAAATPAGATTIQVRSTTGLQAGQQIGIDGETRTIASVGSAASPLTTVFIPVSTDPRHSFSAGTTTLPVASAAGFEVGQKIGIDLGGNYEVATVTAVGKPGTQTTLAAASAAGADSIKLAADANLSIGDALTIGTGAHRELAKVASVGSAGVQMAAPLKFDHASGIDVSDLGTGIRFSPATRFSHSAGDALQALGSGIVLDRPLARGHSYGAAVVDTQAAGAGYQGSPAPNQWFGGTLSANAGSIALMDGAAVVDAVVYGSQQSNSSANGYIASPELATLVGDQDRGGCIVAVAAGQASAGAGKSWGRYPDGADTGSLCNDFHAQAATTLAAPAVVGATNIKVNSVDGFDPGQTVLIGVGAEQQSVVIAAVGTPGATTLQAATAAGATSLTLGSAFGFRPGQAIVIGEGAEQETAEVAAMGRRGAPAMTLSAPLKNAHAAGTPVGGTGITLNSPLTRAHGSGTMVSDGAPTPGAPNRYRARAQ